MIKLLSASLQRLIRDKLLWIAAAVLFTLSAFMIIKNGISVSDIDAANNVKSLNACFFNILPVISFFYAVFISFFIGTDYSDGTIRNKIVIGHSRTDIYFSNYITCFTGSIIILTAMLCGCAAGVPFFGFWQGGIKDFFIKILLCVFITATFTAILTLISMLSSNKAITVVITIIACLVITILSSTIYNVLQESEFTREFISLSADGKVVFGDEIPNPAYVSGVERKIDEWLLQFLPAGQSILIANEEITNPFMNIVYSVIFTIIANVCGVLAFRKKNLK